MGLHPCGTVARRKPEAARSFGRPFSFVSSAAQAGFNELWAAHSVQKPVESKGIANAENVGWRVTVEPKSNMEVDLLVVRDAIAATGIEQVTVAAMYRIVTDILDKQERAFGDFPLDNKTRLIAVLGQLARWREEICFHACYGPTRTKFD
jgi:hypothetical protein